MQEHRGRRHRRYNDGDYYDDSDYEQRPRRRSVARQALDKLEDALGGLGLDSGTSHHSPSTSSRRHYDSRDHSRDRTAGRYYPPSSHSNTHRRYHSSSPTRRSRRSRRDSPPQHRASSRSRNRWERGIEAAVEAGAAEAFRLRKEPGPWKGPKGERVATAAISAAMLGAATEKRKQDHSGGKLGTLGSAVGGLVVNRLVNGPRKEVRG
ncbi:hypothetical protein N657DRAFT_659197 [Parathielavia appendiculata]|uniref:Uncharacterized protein n=1 Tax=Parathielavia appendiculata TaxID=2587402 RepID=A0AAN6YYS0_9PEZI|nr:hypothetical protein N657DRAFT_659197 [Parathielavia appendiculata]